MYIFFKLNAFTSLQEMLVVGIHLYNFGRTSLFYLTTEGLRDESAAGAPGVFSSTDKTLH